MSAEEVLRESEALHEEVRAFITRAGTRAEAEPLALRIASYQARHVEPVARLGRARLGGRAPCAVSEIPALPTDVFRLRRVAAHPSERDVCEFLTSGTSQGRASRGAHAFRTLATYELAALTWAKLSLLRDPVPRRALLLLPSAQRLPESSLSFMADLFVAAHGLRARHVVDLERGVDVDAAAQELTSLSEPILIFGTAFAYVHLCDALAERRLPVPAGSRLMLTGGFKGRSREVPELELRAGLGRVFGLPAEDVIGEYGMTELSSQLYEPRDVGRTLEPSVYRAPPWMFVDAVDPDTLQPLPPGKEGIARLVDLANVDSSIAIQTQDRVVVLPNGDVKLFGRLPGAEARGCSLTIEELWAEARE